MSTIRVAKRKRYAQVSNETIDDRRLSFRARGILTWLLAKPDDWTCDGRAIANATDVEGRDACYTALSELEALGYLHRKRTRDPVTGQWGWDSIVYESPVAPDPDSQDEGDDPSAGTCPVEPNPGYQDPADQDPGNPDSGIQESRTKDPDLQLRQPPNPRTQRAPRTDRERLAAAEDEVAAAQAAKRESDMQLVAELDASAAEMTDEDRRAAKARMADIAARRRDGRPIEDVPTLQEVQ